VTIISNCAKKLIRKFILVNIILIIVMVCFGCGPGVGDYEYDLIGNYKLFRSSAHEVQVIPTSGYQSTTPIIPTKVIEIAWDDKFILAKQVPLLTNKDTSDSKKYGTPNETVINYWILDTSVPKVYGPFNSKDFEENKQALGVPSDLILQDVKKNIKI